MTDYEKENKAFAKAFPYANHVEMNNGSTYIRTPFGGYRATTPYVCGLTGTETMGDAFSALSTLAKTNKEYENRLV